MRESTFSTIPSNYRESRDQKKVIKFEDKYVGGDTGESRVSRITLAETTEGENEKVGHMFSFFQTGNKCQVIIITAHSKNENTYT